MVLEPGGRWPAGGVLVVASWARNDEPQASRAPAAKAAIIIVFVDFINFVWLLVVVISAASSKRQDKR
jgi:hypothetical protein